MADESRTLYEIAWEAHEKAFGCPPNIWGRWAHDDFHAKIIMEAIVEGVPLDTTPEGYDPDDPESRWVG